MTGGRPTTPAAEAKRLQERWYKEQSSLEGDNLLEEANNTIDALVSLAIAAEHMAVELGGHPRRKEFQFDGMDHAPSFAIVTEGPDVNIVINHKLWSFDDGDEMGEEMWAEVMTQLQQFHRRKLDERTVHAMASVLRGKLESMVLEGRIVRKPF